MGQESNISPITKKKVDYPAFDMIGCLRNKDTDGPLHSVEFHNCFEDIN